MKFDKKKNCKIWGSREDLWFRRIVAFRLKQLGLPNSCIANILKVSPERARLQIVAGERIIKRMGGNSVFPLPGIK